jgi:hypothetical protein
MCLRESCRVKLPKTFLAVNLSDAFSFQEQQDQDKDGSDPDVLEMKHVEHKTAPQTPGDAIPHRQGEDAAHDVSAKGKESD